MRRLRVLALAALLALASAETDWCASRRRACERSCGDPAKTDFDCRDKGGGASRSVSCSCEGGGGSVAGPVFVGDEGALKNNPAVNMLQGIGAWPSGMFDGSGNGGSGKQQSGGSSSTPSSSGAPASNASPSNPAYLSGSTPPASSKNNTGAAVGIAVGVTAAACAAIAAGFALVSRRRAAAAGAGLPVAMPAPSDGYPPAKTVD